MKEFSLYPIFIYKLFKKFLLVTLFFWLCINDIFSAQVNDRSKEIDYFVYELMNKYHVPVISLAIIDNGRVVKKKIYTIDKKLKVSVDSLFQSASIGKSVVAYAALRLVDEEKINLDQDVNIYLSNWKIPSSRYTKKKKITLRNILSMTSGLSVSGFYGHFINDELPTLKQILNGEPPAENQSVRSIFIPGSRYYYSGGSYEVLEQLLIDMSGEPFNAFMQQTVLSPLQMDHSQFVAILPKPLWSQAVPGFLSNGEMIEGKWKIISALGAGGMWTTATDLAKFVINIIDSFHGKQTGLISKKLAYEMLSRQKNTDFGLGFVIDGCNKNLNFRKEGHNIGFYNWLITFPFT